MNAIGSGENSLRDHLLLRGLDPDRYSVILDEERQIATFPLWNLSGAFVGYQQYNPNGTKSIRNDEKHRDLLKYFTYVGDEGCGPCQTKKLAAWGFESLELNQRIVFIAEGIFDAVKIHNAGYPALATVSNDPKHLKGLFQALGRTVIAIADNDAAGSKLMSSAQLSLHLPEQYHDLGEMPQDVVNHWLHDALRSISTDSG